MNKLLICAVMMFGSAVYAQQPIDYVNPFLGTATLWDKEDIGYTPTHRTWGAEAFPGSSLPNAMVQLTPVTKFRSGSGYQYEDTTIYGFAHTSKGHWNLCHIPLLPATGSFSPDDYCSAFSHDNESAHPGYYQVFLERYGVNAELTSTLRCAFHKYTFKEGQSKKLIANLTRSNERVRRWEIEQEGDHVFKGFQQTGETMYFYATSNHAIKNIESMKKDQDELSVVNFNESPTPLELRIGFSFVSIVNARENLEKEMLGKSFAQVRCEATATWNTLLSKIKVTGSTERLRGIFYSTLYRSFLWPALRSDANGDFTDRSGNIVNKGFNYYTEPSLWDDYRNKLVLLGMLSPEVAADVIQSLIDKGEKSGFMPTFFHGDHAAPFIAGTYLRGIRGFDVHGAYNLLLRNATLENRSRPHVLEYIDKGYVPERDLKNPVLQTVSTAGVTKTLEYAYDDYAVALLAKALNDTPNYDLMMKRSQNYKNVFDPSTGFMRGRLANGQWIEKFDPEFVYYEYMYREANAWQSSFFAPQDPEGLIGLYPSKEAFEKKLDDLFSTHFTGNEADNMSVFIGQYCQGNQPDHNFPYLYYFVGKQEKTQVILDTIMENFYDMGKDKLAYPGMDDAGEMSAWFVFNAMGLYTFSPADPEYIVSVPLFDKVELTIGGRTTTIIKKNSGYKITGITYGDRAIENYVISDEALRQGKELVITTERSETLAGKSLSRFDFFYAGEGKSQNMFIVKDGRIVWEYKGPKDQGEISDAVLMTNGNIVFAHQHGVTLINKDKEVLWNHDAPKGCEIHTAQPIGMDHVVFVQSGNPQQVFVVNVRTGETARSFVIPSKNPDSVHGQLRHARLTPKGTYLVAHMDLGKVCEYDINGQELLAIDAPGIWSAEPLENGNILISSNNRYVREVTRTGEIVWDVPLSELPLYNITNPQIAIRRPNGNTLINNWFNEWSGSVDLSHQPCQAIEVTPDKKVVWALKSWTSPADLGPSTVIQILDDQGISEHVTFGQFE